MKEIGGYLELELPRGTGFPNDDGLMVASCRNALELVLHSLGPVRRLWVPYFTCDTVLDPVKKLGIAFSRYKIDRRLEVEGLPLLKEGEFLIYTNYFGLKDAYVDGLAEQYGGKLIVDNAQAFYHRPSSPVCSYVYSPRKFVGIPDGGIAFFPGKESVTIEESDYSSDRFSHLIKRIDKSASAGYAHFRKDEDSLKELDVKLMSQLTQRLLNSIDFEEVKSRRRCNFEYLHSSLKKDNLLEIPDLTSFACPMVYPFWQRKKGIKDYLISNRVYVATYWPNVLAECSSSQIEYRLAAEVAFLPLDQRYDKHDMQHIIDLLDKWKWK